MTSIASGKNISCDAGFYRAKRGNGIRSDFPCDLLVFCTEDARLITVRCTGPIEVTSPFNRPSLVLANAVPLTGEGR